MPEMIAPERPPQNLPPAANLDNDLLAEPSSVMARS
jgi:hypothetical protein